MPCPPQDVLAAGVVPAEQARHLIVPFAACESEAWWPAQQQLPPAATPQLRRLLKGMRVRVEDSGDARSLSPPHERVLARELGWTDTADGLLPWAAWMQGQQSGQPPEGAWGLVTLCHWAMGREHATMSDPEALDLSEAESQALMASMRPFFESDGIGLQALTPLRWLARGEALAQPCASLDRVLGRNVDPWLPSASGARVLRRLQNEMQMLLYTHPVNEARQARRQLSVNSVWFSGTGRLGQTTPAPALHVARQLAQPALAEDWPGHAQAWAELDAGPVAALLRRQQAGESVRLSLCGERGSVTLETAPGGLVARLTHLLNKPAWPALLQER